MRRKNTTSEMMKEYICEALLTLMENVPFAELSIGELTAKAGVNRSTYYRNFTSKEDVIRFFYRNQLLDYLAQAPAALADNMEGYLTGMLSHYEKEKEHLLLLHRWGLSYLMLDVFKELFLDGNRASQSPSEEFWVYYHTGGIFHLFMLWFDHDMKESPKEFARMSVEILPNGFKPILISQPL